MNFYGLQGITPVKLPVRVTQDVMGVLIPSLSGQGLAHITIQQSSDQPKTAIIEFCGLNQALVSFDSMGTRGLNYTVLNPMATAIDCQSIENIINHMNENMLG